MAFDFQKFILEHRLKTKVELSEMARVAAVAFKLAPDYESKLMNVKLGAAHKAMIEYLKSKENEPHTVGDISRAIGKDSASINQPYFRENLVNIIFEPVPIGAATTKPKVEDENDVFVEPQDIQSGKRLSKIIDPEDMVLGSDIEDDLEAGILSFGPEGGDEEEEPSASDIEKAEPAAPIGAKGKAATFTLDNDRLLQKLINSYAASKTKVKEAKSSEDIGGMSSKDIKISDKKSKEAAAAKLPELVQQIVDKIKTEDPDVQEAILDILSSKFSSVGYSSLYKRIAKEVGVQAKDTSKEPEAGDEENDEELAEALNELVKQLNNN
jgi:hypothetical protein